jgi:hypothetical protein
MLKAGLISDLIVLLDIVPDAKCGRPWGFLTGVGLMIAPRAVKFETSTGSAAGLGASGLYLTWR